MHGKIKSEIREMTIDIDERMLEMPVDQDKENANVNNKKPILNTLVFADNVV